MKRMICVFIAVTLLLLCSSCNAKSELNKIMNLGDNRRTSNTVDKNAEVSAPAMQEKGWSFIGDEVEDYRLNSITDTCFTYTVTNARIYDRVEDAGLKPENILMYEAYCDEKGEFDTRYKLLLVYVDVFCKQKKENTDYRPNITRLSSVGIINQSGAYEPISMEQIFFCTESGEPSPDQKEYFYYDINESETVSVCCGWMVPNNVKTEELFLCIGSVKYSSDGSVDDNAAYILLKKE